jgi:predicted HAD superfamily hydrolase
VSNAIPRLVLEKTPHTQPTSLLTISGEHYWSLAKRAKVISFDVFDTLIHRRVLLPTDIFGLVGQTIGIADFAEKRSAAEARARRLARPATVEVSLDEIYRAFPDNYLPDPERVKKIELEVEQDYTYANVAMRSSIRDLRAEGCRVVAITDTYFNKEQVGSLLSASQIEVDAIYASSEYRQDNLGKYNGGIYPVVCSEERVQSSEMLHAGDHSESDVANALSQGLVAVQASHPNSYLITNSEHFAVVIDEHKNLTTSLIAGTIARSKLADQSRLASSIESFGYDFGGALVIGMVASWAMSWMR